jgi:hypothetical protein
MIFKRLQVMIFKISFFFNYFYIHIKIILLWLYLITLEFAVITLKCDIIVSYQFKQ